MASVMKGNTAKEPRWLAAQFVPTQHSTAEDKARFASQFVHFWESHFDWHCFPKWFYQRLSMTFGHIAHYNQKAFYEEFFTSPRGLWNFRQITERGGGYGDPAYTYSDVERALKAWLTARDRQVGERATAEWTEVW